MKSYLFIANDGFTYDANHKSIPNMQILGIAEGIDVNEALNTFRNEETYLSKFKFKEIIALETVGDFIRNLKL